MYLLLAGNDTVPISLWRGGSMRSTDECRLVFVYRSMLSVETAKVMRAISHSTMCASDSLMIDDSASLSEGSFIIITIYYYSSSCRRRKYLYAHKNG